MNNMPEVKVGIVAVSRDCFPESLSVNRRKALVEAYAKKYDAKDIYECPICIVESEIHMVQALEDIKKAGCNALCVYLGNFGPEISETLLAKHFDGPKMFIAAAEETQNDLCQGRGDAYCGMLNASYNLQLRNVKAYIPEYPVGDAEDCADMIHEFLPIARAIEGERERQIELLEEGRAIVQETRRWDDNKESSHAMRSKEDAKDYRYFPDPDLPPIHISDAWIEELRASIPELREAKMERYQKEYELPAYDAGILTESRHLAGLFEETAVLLGNPKKVANWFMVEVLRLTKDKGLDPEKVSFTPKHLADLLSMVEKKEVSAQNAKKVFEKVFDEDIDPVVYIEENGLKIVEDTGLLTETVKKIVDANPGPLAELLGGKDKVMGFFVGQLMRELKGKANPDSVRKALAEEIERRR